ncbi:MAG: response regulator [Candidatus Woesearchaeota archaeon]|nr:response regulator [Candidatus Woesearchaeota archaeon]
MNVDETILTLLEKNPNGLSISDISDMLGNTRATLSKYLEMMKLENKVTLREVGRAKLWFLASKKKTILIVEDEPHIRRLIRVVLGEARYNFFEASDGLMGLEMVSQFMPDMIILDLMMPTLDGIKVCSEIKKNALTKKIPIIMLTAKKEMDDKVVGISVGADDYLVKPFEPQELRTRVRTFLDELNAERNPITNLPTLKNLKKDIENKENETKVYHLCFKNLDDYRSEYGLTKTNELIRLTSQMISHILEKTPEKRFFGHDAGNNFILGLKGKQIKDVLKSIYDEFNLTKPFFYEKDFKNYDDRLNIITKKIEEGEVKGIQVVELIAKEIKELEDIPD